MIEEYVTAGGLLSYGANIADNYRPAAGYADRIVRGAKAGDLPIEQSQVFELSIRLRAARAQGIRIPQSILLRADQVIE